MNSPQDRNVLSPLRWVVVALIGAALVLPCGAAHAALSLPRARWASRNRIDDSRETVQLEELTMSLCPHVPPMAMSTWPYQTPTSR